MPDDGKAVEVQICSDLHLEFFGGDEQPSLPPFSSFVVPSAPVLALLGDISVVTPTGSIPWLNYQALLQ